MCPDPTKGKFILNFQLNFTSTPLSLMPPSPDVSITMTGCKLLLPCAYRVMMFSDDLWCDVPCCHDPLMSPPSRDYRCQDPGPIYHSPVYPPTHSLSTDARPEVWCGLVTQCHHESAQSNERYTQVSISPIFVFIWTKFCRLSLFMLLWSETTREVLFCSRDNETRTHSD